jgi:ferritin-like metal-binding protein YciE
MRRCTSPAIWGDESHARADEVLKNSFANYAFASFEVASYSALVIMAEEGGFEAAVPLLNETLREEQMM